jgi:hypothetical protein
VIVIPKVRLALPGDARGIAELSREHIEHGLSWRWTETRVLHSIASRSVNVAVITSTARSRPSASWTTERRPRTSHCWACIPGSAGVVSAGRCCCGSRALHARRVSV